MPKLILAVAALAVGLAAADTATAQPIKPLDKVLKPNPWLMPTGNGGVVPLPYWDPHGPLKTATRAVLDPVKVGPARANQVLLNPQPLPPRLLPKR